MKGSSSELTPLTQSTSPVVVGKASDQSKESSNDYTRKPSQDTTSAKVTKLSWIERKKSYLRLLLSYIIIGCCVVLTVMLARGIRLQLSKAPKWVFSKQPDVAKFNEVVLTSSSEHCNEMMREIWVLEDADIKEVALTMVICLALAEPHANGLAGQSKLLYADAKTGACKETNGHFTTGPKGGFTRLIWFHPNSAVIGEHAAGIGGHVHTIAGLASMIPRSRHEAFAKKLKVMMYETIEQEDRAVVTKLLNALLKAKNTDDIISSSDNYRYLHGLGRIKAEGEVFEQSLRTASTIRMIIDGVHNSFYPSVVETMFMPMKAKAASHEAFEDTEGWKNRLKSEDFIRDGKKLKLGSHEICVPSHDVGAFAAAKVMSERQDKYGPPGIGNMMNISFYEQVVKDIQEVYKIASDTKGMSKGAIAFMIKLQEIYTDLKSNGPAEFPSYGSSMFAIVKGHESIVMTASLGSNLGAMHDSGYIMKEMNNLMFWAGQYFSVMGNNHHTLHPLIAMKDKAISYAYAGSGGFLTRTLDLARMYTTTMLTLLLDVPVEQAVTSPLIYPMPDKTIEYSYGVPWNHVATLEGKKQYFGSEERWKSTVDPTKVDMALTRPDRGVAIQKVGKGYKGLFFDKTQTQSTSIGI